MWPMATPVMAFPSVSVPTNLPIGQAGRNIVKRNFHFHIHCVHSSALAGFIYEVLSIILLNYATQYRPGNFINYVENFLSVYVIN
jgi:hypothetical protein